MLNRTKKIALALVAVAFFAISLSSCHRQTCPTYSQVEQTTEANV